MLATTLYAAAAGDGLFAGLAELICRGGEDALFCRRCIGVWAGCALALPAVFFLRRRIPTWLVLLLAAAFLQMPAAGWGRIELPAAAKALSGQLFAFSAMLGLGLAPARRRLAPRLDKSAAPPILAAAAAGTAVLQSLIHINAPPARAPLDVLCITGLAAAGLLAALFVAASALPRRARRPCSPHSPGTGKTPMKTPLLLLTAAACAVLCAAAAPPAAACTNLLVTRGASADGSVIITYTCDGEFHPRLSYMPAADHEPGELLEIKDWSDNVRGTIAQAAHTYAVVGLMNEHQLAISETTFSGREELRNPEGLLHYFDLMRLALQRAKTARGAIEVITALVDEYGYRSTGESISIADTQEAWILEIIGPGPGGKGAHWVAVRVPDGAISCHANKARIGAFPLDDPDNCLYSENVISFARDKGYWDPASGEPFQFCEAYCPSTPANCRYADGRVWSIFRRAAPSLELPPDRFRGAEGAGPYPLWIEPDKKLALADVFALMRDHFEGTGYDMTRGIDAGPYGTPNRWRPITWQLDGMEYAWERPVSTQQTGFTFVSQSRSWLPDPVGGVYWYGVDDTYLCCYVPLYCGIDAVPDSFARGSLDEFSWDSAWWVFNFVANFANLRYRDMEPDIQAVQRDLEGNLLSLQPAIDKTAVELAASDPALMQRFLTDYCVGHAEQVVERWRLLGNHLIRKYNDGYVQAEPGRPREQGYDEGWLRKVVAERPEQFKLGKKDPAVPESELIDS